MTLRDAILIVLAATVVGAAPGFGPAFAQANCDWYAKTALKQQQDNERLKCGLKGASWSFDLRAHTTWCAGVGPDQWKSEARKRDQQLAACAKK